MPPLFEKIEPTDDRLAHINKLYHDDPVVEITLSNGWYKMKNGKDVTAYYNKELLDKITTSENSGYIIAPKEPLLLETEVGTYLVAAGDYHWHV